MCRSGALSFITRQSARLVLVSQASRGGGRRGPAGPVGLPERCDVVVVGGGVLGLASAYELAGRNLSVVLVESGRAGGRQSGRNLGFVRQQGRAPAELPMMMAASKRWRDLGRELGSDVEWTMGGNLRLTNDPELAGRYEKWAADAAVLGLDSRVVTRAEVESILPGVGEQWLLGIFTASDGHADPVATCRAYAAAARARGVQVCEGVAVQEINLAGGAVTGVTTAVGEVEAGVVVLAAGSGSARLARGAGAEIPRQLVRQTVILTEPVPPLTQAAAWTGELFIRQDVRGCLRLAGATRNEVVLDPAGFRHAGRFLASYLANRSQLRVRADAAGLARALLGPLQSATGDELSPGPRFDDVRFCLDRAQRYFPGLGAVRLRQAWAGEIDATPDALAVIDGGSGPSGLVIATGMSGHGFGLAPVVGTVVADIAEGAEPDFDLRPFRLARFHDGSRRQPAHLM
jgi:glycine/D-amino acid oxidase-like deaminating enzyme